jgi:hypothetical protein
MKMTILEQMIAFKISKNTEFGWYHRENRLDFDYPLSSIKQRLRSESIDIFP